MQIKTLKPKKALNQAFLKVKPNRTEIERFKTNLIQLLDRTNDTESEEFHKNLVIDFLKKTYYDPNHFINTKGKNDLVIHNGNNATSTVGVILEAKKLTNKAEMISTENINKKAFQELVLYYLRERITHKNVEVKQLIITNINEWYIFDAILFDRLFAQNKSFVKQFVDFEEGRLADIKTDFFYTQIVAPFIEEIKVELEFTYFNLQDYQQPLRNENKADDKKLIALFKLLSAEHLLKLPFVNDSNSLDKKFYSELLHIIGLIETKEGSKKLIERNKDGERNTGSILEDTIIQLDSLDKINRLEKVSQYGATQQERLFNVGLELSITWINRILFLKLLEAQLISYHKGDTSYSFLNYTKIKNYDDLNSLFFQVLARKNEERNADVKKAFEKVPYLNSSLFEPTEIEQVTLLISNLKDDKTIPVIANTVLKNNQGKKLTGQLTTLEYLFKFLDAYDFTSEGAEDIQEDNKALINASVLGLIFEKINGYKDGSFFTPGFITMYMCRETIRKAVVQKFNETKKWNCTTIEELYDKIGSGKEERKEANDIVNSLKICDPAVGSGHFLVSALNEMIAVKNDLKILQDRKGKRLKEYQVQVVNDELIVTDEEGDFFEYLAPSPLGKAAGEVQREAQRIQETLFHEKQTIIENCLFGVDINPNSVKICRLRLWIELLKSAYYKFPSVTFPSSGGVDAEGGRGGHLEAEGGRSGTLHAKGERSGLIAPTGMALETLPNIDINIKCGNSLVSRFAIDADLSLALKKSKFTIDSYRIAVDTYRNAESKEQKREMEKLIANIKTDFRSEISLNDPKIKALQKLNGQVLKLTTEQSLFEKTKKEKAEWNKQLEKITSVSKKLEIEIEEIKANKIYENAFEWRFEFPEVLNDNGEFVGFDVVIGNPPYIKEYEGKDFFDGLRNNEVYQGKMDIWYMFLADGIKLLNKKGLLNFIAPNNWTTNSGASKTRNFILNNSKILQLIDFKNFMVFDNASIQTMIMLFSKEKVNNYSFDFRTIKTLKPIYLDVVNLLEKTETDNLEILKSNISIQNNLDSLLTFNSNIYEILLAKLKAQQNFHLDEKLEVAQGIVFPQDFLNKSSNQKVNNKFKVGEGIFGLSKIEKDNLELTEKELRLIKPYFTSEQFFRYYSNPENQLWLIYTSSKFKNVEAILPYPNIKKHLDKFIDVITSDNKPYGLHRTREESFFVGEKIIVQRKCASKPVFTYTDFDSYVSATFYVIKSEKINNKYLVGLLNSKLIEFWLKNKGKMQGNNFQLDKEPILDIPIHKTTYTKSKIIIKNVNKILDLKKQNPATDTTHLETQIDQLVYALYDLTAEEIAIVEAVVK